LGRIALTIRTKNDLKPGAVRLLSIDGTEVALFRVGDRYFAVDNHCPHQHFSKLHEGFLEGTILTCPMHGWSFDLLTGSCTREGGRLSKLTVSLEGEEVVLEQTDR
jgi:nitrite reductase/ring-hydroxylating ferredoxin subunit